MDGVNDTRRKTNVLFCLHNTGAGGVERAMATLAGSLDRGRFRVTAAVPGEGPLTDEMRALGVETVTVPVEWWVPHRSVFGERHYYRFLEGLPERVGRLASGPRFKCAVYFAAPRRRIAARTSVCGVGPPPAPHRPTN